MTTQDEAYRRLPGRAKRHFGMFTRERCYLWLTSDHLLNLRTRGYTESYKRFYLKDIQALVVCKTDAGRIASIVLAVLTGVFGLLSALAMIAWGSWGALAFILPGLLAALLALNALLGPTCVTRLHTDVQVERLASLGRLRTAMRTVALLKPLIESAQGRLTPEDLAAETEGAVTVEASVHASPLAAAASDLRRPFRATDRFHVALFSIFCLDAASDLMEVFYQGPLVSVLGLPLWPATLVLLVLALLRQGRSSLSREIKSITWVAGGFVILNTIFQTCYGTITLLESPELLQSYRLMNVKFEGPIYAGYFAFAGTAQLATGLLGLMALRRFRAARRALDTAPVEPPAPEQKEV